MQEIVRSRYASLLFKQMIYKAVAYLVNIHFFKDWFITSLLHYIMILIYVDYNWTYLDSTKVVYSLSKAF